MLPPHARSPSRSCTSFRSLWSARGRTFTSKTMLDNAVETLNAGERPVIHSDRGGHYR
ncbi:hypothetical protein GKQ17_24520 [Escherichia coli]|nr:hypothetical protein [Escherichia coli]EFH3632011.1 hypothetical protein [Escherichia coli]EFH5799600.1 hypothetical protein [Escherichia coli]EFH7379091.1 hypothetical protein [Escherichia coli]EFH7530737.1 hypothetical protein [Escherichia coli]